MWATIFSARLPKGQLKNFYEFLTFSLIWGLICDDGNSYLRKGNMSTTMVRLPIRQPYGTWHIEAETKWLPFHRWQFQMHFLNENVWISIKISLKFVSKGPNNNIPALFQIMAWSWPGNKPLSEPMMVRLPTHIYASLDLNELSPAARHI